MSTLNQQYRINGIIDTSQGVFENLEQFALAAGCWITYDANLGRWSVIINRAGISIKSFDDFNIIGALDVSSTSLTDYYNRVKVTYARRDLNDQIDFVEAVIPDWQRNPREQDNTLEMRLGLVTDPVQALNIGARELKQSRVNKIVKFVTDYSSIGLSAGDIIDITNSALNWNNKLFRVIQIAEDDLEGGEIELSITAVEYSAAVYNNDLVRLDRSRQNDIITIGGIAQPAGPGITVVDRDSRPRLELSAVVPAGLVAGMEFWISFNGSAFYLQGTERPPAGGVYTTGDTVTLDVSNITAGEIGVRVRALNSTTSSVYSNTTVVTYTPVQVTNAVDPLTQVDDGLGGLATALGLIELLKGVDGLFAGNTEPGTESGNLYESISTLLSDDEEFTGNIANANPAISVIQVGNIPVQAIVNTTVGFIAGNNMTLEANPLDNTVTFNAAGTGTGFNEFKFFNFDGNSYVSAGNTLSSTFPDQVFATVGMDYVVDSVNNQATLVSNSFSQIQTGSDGNIVSSSIDFGNTITQYNQFVIPGQIPANVQYDPGSVVVTSTLEGAVPYIDIQARPAPKSLMFVDQLYASVGLVPGGGPLSVGYDIGPAPGRGTLNILVDAYFNGPFSSDETLGNASIVVTLLVPGQSPITVGGYTWDNTPIFSIIRASFQASFPNIDSSLGNLTLDLTASHDGAIECVAQYYVTQSIGTVESSDYQRQIL